MTTYTQPTEREAPASTRAGSVCLLLLSGALFLEGADIAMLGVVLPSIGQEFGLTAGGSSG